MARMQTQDDNIKRYTNNTGDHQAARCFRHSDFGFSLRFIVIVVMVACVVGVAFVIAFAFGDCPF
jgi:hypothetical protein